MCRLLRVATVVFSFFALIACPATKSPSVVHPTSAAVDLIKPSPAIDGRPESQQTPPFVAPRALLRPLTLPHVRSGEVCPITIKHSIVIGGRPYSGVLGRGPAYLFLEVARDRNGISHYAPLRPVSGWLLIPGTWWVEPETRGPMLIRGRRLDGPSQILLAGWGPNLGNEIQLNTGQYTDLLAPGRFLPQKDIPNTTSDGWTNYPPADVAIREPGCYGFQVDGLTFSYSIVVRFVP